MEQATIGTNISEAVQYLLAGKLVAIPTETVYGLAGNATNANTVAAIFLAKQRPRFNPLILHIGNKALIEQYAHINTIATTLIQQLMPGPLTLLLPKKEIVPDIVTAGSSKVAIRIPNHAVALQLLQQLPFPLAAPSANKFGYVSPTTAMHVANGFTAQEVSYILNGGTTSIGIESTIVEPTPTALIVHRLGGTTMEHIAAAIEVPIVYQTKATNTPETAGQIKSHYATNTALYKGNVTQLLQQFYNKKIAIISLQKKYACNNNTLTHFVLSEEGNTSIAAAKLFATMRLIDNEKFDIILAEDFPNEGLGVAINDRLHRAQFILKK